MSPTVLLVYGIWTCMNSLVARATRVSSTPPSMPMTSVGEMLPKLSRSMGAGTPARVALASVILAADTSVSVPNGVLSENPSLKETVAASRFLPATWTPGATLTVPVTWTYGSASGSETTTVVTSSIVGAPGATTAARLMRWSGTAVSSWNDNSTLPSSSMVDGDWNFRSRKPRWTALPATSADASIWRSTFAPGTRNTSTGVPVEMPTEKSAS